MGNYELDRDLRRCMYGTIIQRMRVKCQANPTHFSPALLQLQRHNSHSGLLIQLMTETHNLVNQITLRHAHEQQQQQTQQ